MTNLINNNGVLPEELINSHEYALLTDKQKVFVEEFMRTGDEVHAGKVAGYHKTNARKVLLSAQVQKVLNKYWEDYAITNNKINTTEETLIMLSNIAYANENTNTIVNAKTGEVIKTPPNAMERIKAMELLLKVSGALSGSNQVNININDTGKIANVDYVTAEDIESFDLSEVVDINNYDVVE